MCLHCLGIRVPSYHRCLNKRRKAVQVTERGYENLGALQYKIAENSEYEKVDERYEMTKNPKYVEANALQYEMNKNSAYEEAFNSNEDPTHEYEVVK